MVNDYDISSVQGIMSAAAPLTPELVLDVYNRLKIPVKQAYGLSETSPATHLQVKRPSTHNIAHADVFLED
jgi:4-coumarate--CoA ligase